MRQIRRRLFLAAVAAVVLGLGLDPPAVAHDGHDHGDHPPGGAAHGGTLAEAGHHRFEVVFEEGGLRVYPLGGQLGPEAISRLKGRAYFLMPGAKQYSAPYELRPVAPAPGRPAEALGLDVGLGRVPVDGTKVTFQVWGLPDPAAPTAEFTVPFALGRAGAVAITRATQADRAAIAAQETCPVSGEELGSMGVPLKVARGGRSVFLCCQGCIAKVKADPDEYLGAELTITQATAADREALAALKACPVSGEELGSMGVPLKVARGDQFTYVCCKGCVKEIQADPEKYLGAEAPDPTGDPAHDRRDHDH